MSGLKSYICRCVADLRLVLYLLDMWSLFGRGRYRWCCCFDTASSMCSCVDCCSILLFMNLFSYFAISIDFATALTLVIFMFF